MWKIHINSSYRKTICHPSPITRHQMISNTWSYFAYYIMSNRWKLFQIFSVFFASSILFISIAYFYNQRSNCNFKNASDLYQLNECQNEAFHKYKEDQYELRRKRIFNYCQSVNSSRKEELRSFHTLFQITWLHPSYNQPLRKD